MLAFLVIFFEHEYVLIAHIVCFNVDLANLTGVLVFVVQAVLLIRLKLLIDYLFLCGTGALALAYGRYKLPQLLVVLRSQECRISLSQLRALHL